MVSYDVACNIRQAQRALHPRLLSEMASYDVAINIWPALGGGAGGGARAAQRV